MQIYPELGQRLVELARTKGLALLERQPIFSGHKDLAYVLVGLAASGLYHTPPELEVAVVADETAYAAISQHPAWAGGHAWETVLDGVPFQYYCVTRERIEAGLRELRDSYVYRYGNAVVLRDPGGQCAKFLEGLRAALPQFRKQRLEGKLDMLRRRFPAYEAALRDGDAMTAAAVGLELITLAVKVTALLDDVPFDPRKRLLQAALVGRMGYRVEGSVQKLIGYLGELHALAPGADVRAFRFPALMLEVINILSEEARVQGFAVGLAQPDWRCWEAYVAA